MAGSILSGVYRDRMADAELPGTTQGLSTAAGDQARTSAEAARSLADSLNLPELAPRPTAPSSTRCTRPRPPWPPLAFIGCAVAVVGLRTRAAAPPQGARDREARDEPMSDTSDEPVQTAGKERDTR